MNSSKRTSATSVAFMDDKKRKQSRNSIAPSEFGEYKEPSTEDIPTIEDHHMHFVPIRPQYIRNVEPHIAHTPGASVLHKNYDVYTMLAKRYLKSDRITRFRILAKYFRNKCARVIKQIYPWPPKLFAGLFWTYGYYDDMIGPERKVNHIAFADNLFTKDRLFTFENQFDTDHTVWGERGCNVKDFSYENEQNEDEELEYIKWEDDETEDWVNHYLRYGEGDDTDDGDDYFAGGFNLGKIKNRGKSTIFDDTLITSKGSQSDVTTDYNDASAKRKKRASVMSTVTVSSKRKGTVGSTVDKDRLDKRKGTVGRSVDKDKSDKKRETTDEKRDLKSEAPRRKSKFFADEKVKLVMFEDGNDEESDVAKSKSKARESIADNWFTNLFNSAKQDESKKNKSNDKEIKERKKSKVNESENNDGRKEDTNKVKILTSQKESDNKSELNYKMDLDLEDKNKKGRHRSRSYSKSEFSIDEIDDASSTKEKQKRKKSHRSKSKADNNEQANENSSKTTKQRRKSEIKIESQDKNIKKDTNVETSYTWKKGNASEESEDLPDVKRRQSKKERKVTVVQDVQETNRSSDKDNKNWERSQSVASAVIERVSKKGRRKTAVVENSKESRKKSRKYSEFDPSAEPTFDFDDEEEALKLFKKDEVSNHSLYISNLQAKTKVKDLQKIFPKGQITFSLTKHGAAATAFVHFDKSEDCRKAYLNSKGIVINGIPMVVAPRLKEHTI